MVPGCLAAPLWQQKPLHSWWLEFGADITRPRYQTLNKERSVFQAFQAQSEVGQYETSL